MLCIVCHGINSKQTYQWNHITVFTINHLHLYGLLNFCPYCFTISAEGYHQYPHYDHHYHHHHRHHRPVQPVQPVYSPDSEQSYTESYHSTPGHSHYHHHHHHHHQKRQDSPGASDYSAQGQSYHCQTSEEGPRVQGYRELGAGHGPDHLQDSSGGYLPDSAESGSTDADTYDTMQV